MKQENICKIYTDNNWKILPVSFNKIPLIKGGCRSASADYDQYLAWKQHYKKFNIGIATGKDSGIWVIDIDMKDGVNGFQSLLQEYGDSFSLDTTNQLIAETPSGGLHLVFKWNEEIPVTVATGILEGVDIRGEGGYIVAAPSALCIDQQWKKYKWNNIYLPIPDAPDWAVDLAKKSISQRKTSINDGPSTFDVIPAITGLEKGKRDLELFRYACHLKGRNVPQDLAIAFIQAAASRCKPPFPEDSAVDKVRRAYSLPNSTSTGA